MLAAVYRTFTRHELHLRDITTRVRVCSAFGKWSDAEKGSLEKDGRACRLHTRIKCGFHVSPTVEKVPLQLEQYIPVWSGKKCVY